MARVIDSIPAPTNPLPMKVIVLSLGRNGTLGLHRALNVLGYRAYHFSVCFEKMEHVKVCIEAMEAKFFGKGQPFGREEFDKWFQDFDALTDVPAFFAPELAAAYPDAKFILTWRETDAWLRSIHKTFVPLQKAQDQFPLWPMRVVEPFTNRFFHLTALITRLLWQDHGMYEGLEADRLLRETYEKHNEMVRSLVPATQLCIIKLEDGLGWPQICPFLDCKTPDVAYPRGNDPDEFGKLVEGFMMKHWVSSFTKAVAVVLPIGGLGTWYLTTRK